MSRNLALVIHCDTGLLEDLHCFGLLEKAVLHTVIQCSGQTKEFDIMLYLTYSCKSVALVLLC